MLRHNFAAMDGSIGINGRKAVRLDMAATLCSRCFHDGLPMKLRSDIEVRWLKTQGSEIGSDETKGSEWRCVRW